VKFQLEPQSRLSDTEAKAIWTGDPLAALAFMPYPLAREFWIARDANGRVVGRVGSSISLHHPERGYLGFFWLADSLTLEECSQVGAMLLEQACRHLAENGAQLAVGPIALNTWFPYRFLIEPKDDFRFSWEPSNPSSWPEIWKSSGFEIEMTYASEGFSELARFADRIRPAHENAVAAGFRFVPIDTEHLLDHEIPKLYRLSMAGFADAHLFEPLPESLFRQLYVPLADKNARGQLRHSCFIEAPNGETIGFSFNFVQGNRLILKTIAVLPEFRGKGLSNGAMLPGVDLAVREGIQDWVTALVRTGAQSESYGRQYPSQWRHDYVLFSKKLALKSERQKLVTAPQAKALFPKIPKECPASVVASSGRSRFRLSKS
jgi:GNAT superfamily N-acetyltransferase